MMSQGGVSSCAKKNPLENHALGILLNTLDREHSFAFACHIMPIIFVDALKIDSSLIAYGFRSSNNGLILICLIALNHSKMYRSKIISIHNTNSYYAVKNKETFNYNDFTQWFIVLTRRVTYFKHSKDFLDFTAINIKTILNEVHQKCHLPRPYPISNILDDNPSQCKCVFYFFTYLNFCWHDGGHNYFNFVAFTGSTTSCVRLRQFYPQGLVELKKMLIIDQF